MDILNAPAIQNAGERREDAMYRIAGFLILALALLQAGPSPSAGNLDEFESALVEEINKIRSDPKSYVPLLERFRARFSGNAIMLDGNIRVMSREGTAVVDEAVAYLRTVAPAGVLAAADCLNASAEDLHEDQKKTGALGHKGSDGSGPGERIRKHCSVRGRTGESLSYGTYAGETPQAVVMQLVVDDGVRDRIHRIRMFDPSFMFIGVSCGAHPRLGFMCVINTAPDLGGKK